MEIIVLIVGIVLVLKGRDFFWLFMALLGFEIGFDLSIRAFGAGQPIALAVAIVCGLLAAYLVLAFNKLAITIAGLLGGAYIAILLLQPYGQVVMLIGGVVGAILGIYAMQSVFGLAITVLTSILGAQMILKSVHVDPGLALILLVAISAFGIFFQLKGPAIGRSSRSTS